MDLLLTVAAPLDRCAELLGDLASLREAAAKGELPAAPNAAR